MAAGSFEQFDNSKHTPPPLHERRTPTATANYQSPQRNDESVGGDACSGPNRGDDDANGVEAATTSSTAAGGSSSEFSGLVSYFSSQQDDLET